MLLVVFPMGFGPLPSPTSIPHGCLRGVWETTNKKNIIIIFFLLVVFPLALWSQGPCLICSTLLNRIACPPALSERTGSSPWTIFAASPRSWATQASVTYGWPPGALGWR